MDHVGVDVPPVDHSGRSGRSAGVEERPAPPPPLPFPLEEEEGPPFRRVPCSCAAELRDACEAAFSLVLVGLLGEGMSCGW